MSSVVQVLVPDIGNFESVEVIEILVKEGDVIAFDDSLITVESDKASMDIPSSQAGIVKSLKVKVGDKIAQGTLMLEVEVSSSAETDSKQAQAAEVESQPISIPHAVSTPETPVLVGQSDIHAEVVVLGSGPGGYTAAFRAADLGKKVVLIERYATLGGVCLNVGCIPSKALLHTAKVITEAEETAHHGVSFSAPNIDLEQLRHWKTNDVVAKLTGGLAQMAKQREVTTVQGLGQFTSPNQMVVTAADGKVTSISFEHAIIAAGSQATKFPGAPEDDRIMDSTGALKLDDIPKKLLVIGGGIIGLEMGTVYDALGSKVSVVEFTDGLIQGCDRDLIRPLQKRMEKRFENKRLENTWWHVFFAKTIA